MPIDTSNIADSLIENLTRQILLAKNRESNDIIFTDFCSSSDDNSVLFQVLSGNVFNQEIPLYKCLGIYLWIPMLDEDDITKFEKSGLTNIFQAKGTIGFFHNFGLDIDSATSAILCILSKYYNIVTDTEITIKAWDTNNQDEILKSSISVSHSLLKKPQYPEIEDDDDLDDEEFDDFDEDDDEDSIIYEENDYKRNVREVNKRRYFNIASKQPGVFKTPKKLEQSQIQSQIKKTWSSSKHFKAYNFVRDLILEGRTDQEILKIFEQKHLEDPSIYSVHGGSTISKRVLKQFRAAVEQSNQRKPSGLSSFQEQQSISAKEWKENSVGYNWVKDKLLQGWAPSKIVEEFNILHKTDPQLYSTSMGKPLTAAILSGWKKQMFPQTLNQSIRTAIEWRKNSAGYQWVKKQVLNNVPLETILEEFNKRHKEDKEFSGVDGNTIRIGTLQKWRIEILTHKYE